MDSECKKYDKFDLLYTNNLNLSFNNQKQSVMSSQNCVNNSQNNLSDNSTNNINHNSFLLFKPNILGYSLIKSNANLSDSVIKNKSMLNNAMSSSIEDSSAKDLSIEDLSANNSSVKDSSVKDSSVKDPSIEDLSANNSSVKDSSVKDSSVKDSSVKDFPVNNSSAKDFSVNNSSIKDLSKDNLSKSDLSKDIYNLPFNIHNIKATRKEQYQFPRAVDITAKFDNNSDEITRNNVFVIQPLNKLENISAEYNKNYLRNAILGLLKYNKPVILTGELQFNPYDKFYTFVNIKPFYPEYAEQTKILCQHINISKRQIDAVLNLYGNKDYTRKPLVLICKPYIYKSNNNEDRGGLNLTAELGVPGIMTYDDALNIIPKINKNKYIDFLDFGNGSFLGIDGLEQKKQKVQKKIKNRLLKKKQKSEESQQIDNFLHKPSPINHTNITVIKKLLNSNITKKTKVLDGWFLKV